jgi:hypothetical protein
MTTQTILQYVREKQLFSVDVVRGKTCKGAIEQGIYTDSIQRKGNCLFFTCRDEQHAPNILPKFPPVRISGFSRDA